MVERVLNENDNKLLNLCRARPHSVNELSKLMGISAKNVSVRLKRLEKEKFIVVNRQGKGKKTRVMSSEGVKKIEKDSIEVLKELRKFGEVKFSKFNQSILPVKEEDTEAQMYSKLRAKNYILFSDYVDMIVRISKEGKRFLKETHEHKPPNL